MKNFIDYIEESCKNIEDTQISYKYKRKLLDEMTERANEITMAGLRDEKVLADLIATEYPNIEENYTAYKKSEKKKARASLFRKLFALGGVLFFIAIFVVYFSISASTHAWDKTWLIIVGGIFTMIIFYMSLLAKRLYLWKRWLHPLVRLIIAGCIVLLSVFMFLFVLAMLDPGMSWTIIIMGVMLALVADLIFAFATKQKFRTIFAFVYMPIIATMLYIILAGFNVVSWLGGWPIIFIGIALDLIIAFAIISHNAKYFMYKQGDDE